MMGNGTPFIKQSQVTPSAQDLDDIQKGQTLYNKFKNKQITCKQLKDDDLEKIGEYVMNQRFDSTNNHIQMNERAKQMMGENGEEQMHIRLGKNATGCTNGQGGVYTMMGWGYNGMMGSGLFIIPFLVQIVILIDLILVGIWLWKQIQKK
jgi:hypothetical protein